MRTGFAEVLSLADLRAVFFTGIVVLQRVSVPLSSDVCLAVDLRKGEYTQACVYRGVWPAC